MIRVLAPGFLLTAAMGVGAYLLSTVHDAIDALVVALLMGMLLRWLLGSQRWFSVVVAYAKDLQEFLIPIGILLYALTINIQQAVKLPGPVHVSLAATVFVLFVVALGISRLLKLPTKTGWLTAVGSAICGASAICITSRAVDADEDDVSNSMIATVVVGLAAVALCSQLPFLQALQPDSFGSFCGATLQQTGLVKMATSNLPASIQSLALSVKALRIALLPFLALAFFFVAQHRGTRGRKTFLVAVLIAFIAIVVLLAVMPNALAAGHVKSVRMLATVLFSIALANLGLTIDLRRTRLQPIVVAAVAWVCGAATFLAMS